MIAMLELAEQTLIEEAKDVELITKIVQVSFFDDATQEDILKAIWLLNRYTNMIDLISNYEFVLKEENDGLNEYDMSGAEGRAKRLEVSDTISNVTANTVIMMDQRHENYLLYKKITNRVQYAINNIRDPHEGLVAKLLFIDGIKYLKAQSYCEKGYKKDLYGISATTFADKRRRAIANIANSLKINRTLDFVIIDYGRGRNKNGEIGLRLPRSE
jgi:hypothetical protein